MSGVALALLIGGGSENWPRKRWKERFARALPDHRIVLIPEDEADPASVRYAAVWLPPTGALSGFANLKAIFNLGAGVDALLGDPDLPRAPIVRAVSPDLTARMSEYVLLHVLMYHRQQQALEAAQKRRAWTAPYQWAAKELRAGVMGLGVLGLDAARKLQMVGFDVAGWSRSHKAVPDIRSFAGNDELGAFLARTDVLVALLPATPQTRGILNRKLFAQLARDGVLGGPVLINAGRGALQADEDILAALDEGVLLGATLDVFEREPLPESSPFWMHPKVRITPHNAADSDPDAIVEDIAEQIRAFERGGQLRNVVDPARGY